jgi:hypothetical protein
MADGLTLGLKITADGSQAKKEIEDVRKLVAKEARQIAQELSRATSPGGAGNITNALIAESQRAIQAAQRTATAAGSSIQDTSTRLNAARTNAASLTATFQGILAPASEVAGVITAIGGAALGAAAALFALAKRTAEHDVALADLAAATGLSVENISALSIAGERQRVTVEQLTTGINGFEGALARAARGNVALRETFQAFGINARAALHDPDQALEQFLKRFAEMPEDARRNTLAMRLGFGSPMIQIFDEVGGNLAQFREHLRETGELLTEQGAARAREFQNAIRELGHEVGGFATAIGRGAASELTRAMEDISHALHTNLGSWRTWQDGIAVVLADVRANMNSYYAAWRAVLHGESPLEAGNAAYVESMTESMQRYHAPPTSERNRDRTGIDERDRGGANRAQQERLRQLQEETRRIDAEYREQTATIRRDLDLQYISIAEATERITAAENARFEARQSVLLQQRGVEDTQSGRDRVDRELADAQTQRDNAIQAATDAQNKRELDALRAHRERMLALIQTYEARRTSAIQDAMRARALTEERGEQALLDIQLGALARRTVTLTQDLELAGHNVEAQQRIRDELAEIQAEGLRVAEEGNERVAAGRVRDEANAQAHADRLAGIERGSLRLSVEIGAARIAEMRRHVQNVRGIIYAEQENRVEAAQQRYLQNLHELGEEQNRELREARTAEQRLAIQQRYQERAQLLLEQFNDEKRRIRERGSAEDQLQNPLSDRSMFGDSFTDNLAQINAAAAAAGESIGGFEAHMRAAAQTAADFFATTAAQGDNWASILGDAYQNVKAGLASTLAVHIATGKSMGAVFRQILADELLTISKRAFVKAIEMTALGFGLLAVGSPKAGAAFASAALWAVVGVGAAVGARAVAPRATQEAYGGAAGASGGSSSGNNSNNTNNQPRTIEQRRNEPQRIFLHIQSNDSHIVRVIEQNVSTDGSLRGLIVEAATG